LKEREHLSPQHTKVEGKVGNEKGQCRCVKSSNERQKKKAKIRPHHGGGREKKKKPRDRPCRPLSPVLSRRKEGENMKSLGKERLGFGEEQKGKKKTGRAVVAIKEI